MLPFTKRPGRDESGDNDVVTKDDLVKPDAVPAPPASKLSPTGAAAGRGKFPSMNDEEMTTLMPTKSLGDARPAVRPAAGTPPPSKTGAVPSSRPAASGPVSRVSSAARSGKFATMDEDEDGRTVVRGAPKIVKRGNASSSKMGMPTSPTTISPAAVIKATLESARAGGAKSRTGEHLMAGPPADLLEDLSDRHPADVGAEHTAILQAPSSGGSVAPPPMIAGVKAIPTQMLQPQQMPQGTIPPGSARPLTNPPPPSNQSGGYAAQSGGYAAQSGGYPAQFNGPAPSGSVSIPGMSPSMPAHFMVPQAPYSDGRMDPPGTAVTARTKVGGRPAVSWAIALAAFGLFVGVGAVAVMHGNDSFTETSASFVDPSRAAAGKPGAAAAAAGQPAAAAPTPVPVAEAAPAVVGVPPVAVPVAPAAPPPDTVAAPVVSTPAAHAAAAPAPAAVAPPAAAAAAAAPAVTAAPATAALTARPAAAPRPAFVPASRPVTRPAPAPAEEVASTPAKPTKPVKPTGKDTAVDEEQRKALKALQESQLETPF